MKLLALVPARSGSKRLPGKNKLILGSKPLVLWSIDTVKEIPSICDVLVSTDDSEIADLCKKAGALVPWMRPTELSEDTSSSVDVALHALDWYERKYNIEVDGLLLLQPTSPYRTIQTIERGIQLFKSSKFRPIIGVSLAKSNPSWMFKIEDEFLKPLIEDDAKDNKAQHPKKIFEINGALYLISPKDLRFNKSFISKETLPLVIESGRESLDIDTHMDWKIAQCFLNETEKNE